MPLNKNEGTKKHQSEPTDSVSENDGTSNLEIDHDLSHVQLCDNVDASHEGDTSTSIEFEFENESEISSDCEEACRTLMALVTDSTGSIVTSTDGQGLYHGYQLSQAKSLTKHCRIDFKRGSKFLCYCKICLEF